MVKRNSSNKWSSTITLIKDSYAYSNSFYYYRYIFCYNILGNIPPTIKIITPELEKLYIRLFNYTFKIPFPFVTNPLIFGKLLVEVNAQDNVGIESVRFYIDNIYRESENYSVLLSLYFSNCQNDILVFQMLYR